MIRRATRAARWAAAAELPPLERVIRHGEYAPSIADPAQVLQELAQARKDGVALPDVPVRPTKS